MSPNASAFGAAQARAFDQTEAHLEVLAAEYDRVVRAAGVRAATAFSELALTAAAGDPPWVVPPLDDLIDVTRVTQELLGATEATRTQAAINATRPILSAMGVSFSLEAPMVKDLVSRTGVRAAALSIPGLQDAVRAAITAAFEQGLSVPQTAALIAQKANGLAAYQSEMLARTDLIGTANGGSLLAAKAVWPEQGTLLKRWTNATNSRTENDGHIRPTHLEANGQLVDLDERFLVGEDELLFPGDPRGTDAEVCNCFPAETEVEFPALRAAMRRWYEGDLIRVRFASGDVLAATPNHPVLRADGLWTALGEIEEGDYLVSASSIGKRVGAPDPQRPPVTISEVYRFANDVGEPHRVGTSPLDLHGDGMNGEVEVVPVNGSLLRDCEAASEEEVAKFGFSLTALARIRYCGGDVAPFVKGWTERGRLLASGLISGDRERSSLPVVERTHPDRVGFASPTDRESELPELSDNGRAANSYRFGDGEDGFPGRVTLAEVVIVERESFHGFVYNLDTGEGWFTASGIVCRNCRCSIIYEEPATVATAWDESKHPRHHKGEREGGRFAGREGWPDRGYTPAKATPEQIAQLRARFGADPRPFFDAPGDGGLLAIAKIQGFDGLPQVVSHAELDAMIEGGAVELWRGFADGEDIAEQAKLLDWVSETPLDLGSGQARAEAFRDGAYYAGQGTWGNGTYTAQEPKVAVSYAAVLPIEPDQPQIGWISDPYKHPAIVRMALRPEARVANGTALRAEWASHMGVDAPNRGQVPATSEALGLDSDLGRYAAAEGYDAIDLDDGTGFHIVLNRTSVVVAEAAP